MKLQWIKDVNWKQGLKDTDLGKIADLIGIEGFIKLMEEFSKTYVYFTEKPIVEMMKDYILNNYKSGDARDLARKIGVSEQFVFIVASTMNKDPNQIDIFPESK